MTQRLDSNMINFKSSAWKPYEILISLSAHISGVPSRICLGSSWLVLARLGSSWLDLAPGLGSRP